MWCQCCAGSVGTASGRCLQETLVPGWVTVLYALHHLAPTTLWIIALSLISQALVMQEKRAYVRILRRAFLFEILYEEVWSRDVSDVHVLVSCNLRSSCLVRNVFLFPWFIFFDLTIRGRLLFFSSQNGRHLFVILISSAFLPKICKSPTVRSWRCDGFLTQLSGQSRVCVRRFCILCGLFSSLSLIFRYLISSQYSVGGQEWRRCKLFGFFSCSLILS